MKFWPKNQENKLYILVVKPGKAPYLRCIAHSVDTLQQVVGGELEVVRTYPDGIALICNKHAKRCALPPNRRITGKDGYIAGTFFICQLGKRGFASLPSRLQKVYGERFAKPDKFIVIGKTVCCYPEDAIPELYRFWSAMKTGELAVIGKIDLSM